MPDMQWEDLQEIRINVHGVSVRIHGLFGAGGSHRIAYEDDVPGSAVSGMIYISSDGGTSWEEASRFGSPLTITFNDFSRYSAAGDGRVIFMPQYGKPLFSYDYGSTWDSLRTPTEQLGRINAVHLSLIHI